MRKLALSDEILMQIEKPARYDNRRQLYATKSSDHRCIKRNRQGTF